MANLIDELKQTYKQGSSVIRLIYINVAIFVLFRIVFLVLYLTESTTLLETVKWFSVPSSPLSLLLKPWTIITYMFYHEDILHILFNMLWLYWFGKIFLHFFNEKKLTALYILGGIAGAVLYVVAYNTIPVFTKYFPDSILLGASAGVMAIVFAVSFYAPNFKIMLLFFGEVKLIYIALISILLDVITMAQGNAGGHIAHIGGAFVGWLWSVQYRKGHDFTLGFTRFLDGFFSLFTFKPRLTIKHKKPVDDFVYNRSKAEYQKEIDRILDKISKAGYDSLTKQEKETLFKLSDKK